MIDAKKQTIGIAGVGYVGGAVKNWFRKKEYPLVLYDKYKELGSMGELNRADVIFLCLPTPFDEENGKGFDDSALWEVLGEIKGEKVIVVKSTVLPGSTENFQKNFPQHKFLFNPEFLVAKTARQDFLKPERQIIGYTEQGKDIAEQVMTLLPEAPFKKIIPATEAEMVKYFGNTFLSNRVIFANQMYDVCEKLGVNYETVKECAAADRRIGPHHFDVHHDGYRGYGGMCLPKDTKAFIQFCERIGHEPKLHKILEEINETLRGLDPLKMGQIQTGQDTKLGQSQLAGTVPAVGALSHPQTILVTGGAGFIGSHVTKRLVEMGHNIVIVDNFNKYYDPQLKEARISDFLKDHAFKLYRVDIADFDALKGVFQGEKIDRICHLAAQAGVRYSLENPHVYQDSNVKGTLNLLELAKEYGIKGFIYASSSSVYGGNTKEPFSESDSTDRPISLYAATKKAVEAMAHTYHHLYKLPVTGLRYFTVYGEWGRPDMAAWKFTEAIMNGRPIDVYNEGKMWRDFTYIDDVVEATIAALSRNHAHEIINIGSNKPVELNYFIETLEKLLEKKAERNNLPIQPGDVAKTHADISKAKKLLDWEPRYSIEDGLAKFVDWYMGFKLA